MPPPNHIEMNNVKTIAGSASALSEAASDLIDGLTMLSNPAHSGATSLFSIHRSSTETVQNFKVSTVHGTLEAVFDHAFKGDRLVGRYRFFTLEGAPGPVAPATEIWTVLFDVNHCASWEPDDATFTWQFAPGTYHTAQSLGEFVFRLLAKQQAALPRY